MDSQTNQVSGKQYALYQRCSVHGDVSRVNTAPYTQAGREALQEQADRMNPRGSVVTETEQ